METPKPVTEVAPPPADELPGFFDRAAKPLRTRKTDRFGNFVRKSLLTPKQKQDIEKRLKSDVADSKAEVQKLLSMTKTAEITAMGFEPNNPKKEKDVTIILKRMILGKPEFVLKSNKKPVKPETSSLGGVNWVYDDRSMRKVVINAVNSVRLTEETVLTEKIVKREDGKYEVVSKDGKRSFGTYGTEQAALKRLRQIEYFKHVKG